MGDFFVCVTRVASISHFPPQQNMLLNELTRQSFLYIMQKHQRENICWCFHYKHQLWRCCFVVMLGRGSQTVSNFKIGNDSLLMLASTQEPWSAIFWLISFFWHFKCNISSILLLVLLHDIKYLRLPILKQNLEDFHKKVYSTKEDPLMVWIHVHSLHYKHHPMPILMIFA